MASAVYPKYKEALLNASASSALTGAGATGLYAALVNTGVYTYSAAHQFYSDLSGLGGTDQEIGTVTLTNGLVSGANVTWTAVAGAVTYGALVLYRKNAGANTTWRLVAFIDSGTGLPVTSNGSDIISTWNAAGIVQF